MPLSKEKMKEYQRNRRKGLQKDVKRKPVNPDLVNPVNPICKPIVNHECKPCPNCKLEYKRGFQAGHDRAKVEIVSVGVSGDTVYEPDPVKPVKAPKQSVSKAVQPVVNAMLSGINKRMTVSHHHMCTCAMCKPVSVKT